MMRSSGQRLLPLNRLACLAASMWRHPAFAQDVGFSSQHAKLVAAAYTAQPRTARRSWFPGTETPIWWVRSAKTLTKLEGVMPFERPGDALRTIISGAQARLVAGGTLLVEHGVDRRDTILQLFVSAHFPRLILEGLGALPDAESKSRPTQCSLNDETTNRSRRSS
jgi:hypothetical protein